MMYTLKRRFYLFIICATILLLMFDSASKADRISNGSLDQSARQVKVSTLRTGIFNLTFKSKIDSSIQPLVLKIPKDYSQTKQWPLLVTLHGMGDGPIIVPQIDSMIQIGPYGRGDLKYRGIGEKDVFECIEMAKQMYNIDPNRIYLCGFSMGGAGAFELGLKYPDKWAACVPVCGYLQYTELIENGNNLPFWIHTGSEDMLVPAEGAKEVYDQAKKQGFEHWKYTEHKGMGHSFSVGWEEIEEWLLRHNRIQKASDINFICENPGRIYWVEIKDKSEESEKAYIKARIVDQKILLNTRNVSDFVLHLDSAPIETNKEIVISENNKEIFRGELAIEKIFEKSSKSDKNG